MSQASQISRGHRESSQRTSEDILPSGTGEADRAESFARNAVIVGAAFVLSRLLGLVREIAFAAEFGTQGVASAYVSAFRIPDLLFLVIMAGSFGAAFIPVFAGFLGRGDQRRAWELASAVLTWAGLGIAAGALVCFVLARPLMEWVVAPGLSPENTTVAVDLMRILLLSPVFLGFGIAAKGILEAHHRFTLPALAPVFYNLAIIVGIVSFAPEYGIEAVAWAVIAGAVLHVVVQLPGLVRAGIRFRPRLSREVDGLREVGRLLLPRVIGQAAFQINFIAVNYFATQQGEQQAAALNYAWQLMMLPHGVLALSISTVIFPTLAQLYDQGRQGELRATFSRSLRPLIFLTLPASVGLVLLREPIVQTVFQRGAFNDRSTSLVVAPLAWLGLGLLGYAVVEILTRVYYAIRDTRTPVITGLLIIVANILLCALFVDSLSLAGLAVALSATTGVEAIILLGFLRSRLGGLFSDDFGRWLWRVILANLLFTLVVWPFAGLMTRASEPGLTSRGVAFLFLTCGVGLFAFAYALTCHYLRIPEIRQVIGRIAVRLPARLRSPLDWLRLT
ncbi:MAG: murein biosynthesis integral membrane protein MurJ [Chloroflexia bacterium]|nr:murein biosynthesis integral membrane protein MurJ [Chloroflexia bacterium]